MLTLISNLTGMKQTVVFGWIILGIFTSVITAVVMKYLIVRY